MTDRSHATHWLLLWVQLGNLFLLALRFNVDDEDDPQAPETILDKVVALAFQIVETLVFTLIIRIFLQVLFGLTRPPPRQLHPHDSHVLKLVEAAWGAKKEKEREESTAEAPRVKEAFGSPTQTNDDAAAQPPTDEGAGIKPLPPKATPLAPIRGLEPSSTDTATLPTSPTTTRAPATLPPLKQTNSQKDLTDEPANGETQPLVPGTLGGASSAPHSEGSLDAGQGEESKGASDGDTANTAPAALVAPSKSQIASDGWHKDKAVNAVRDHRCVRLTPTERELTLLCAWLSDSFCESA